MEVEFTTRIHIAADGAHPGAQADRGAQPAADGQQPNFPPGPPVIPAAAGPVAALRVADAHDAALDIAAPWDQHRWPRRVREAQRARQLALIIPGNRQYLRAAAGATFAVGAMATAATAMNAVVRNPTPEQFQSAREMLVLGGYCLFASAGLFYAAWGEQGD